MLSLHAKTRLLKGTLVLSGAICLALFILVRIRGASVFLLDKNEYFTARDLYKESYIAHFREPHPAFEGIEEEIVPYQHRPENPPINEADILTCGDSFFNFKWIKSFPEVLRDRTGKKVFFRKDYNPFHFLETEHYRPRGPRLLIYEIGERGILKGFGGAQPLMTQLPAEREEPLFQVLKTGEAEKRYTVLLQLNALTHRIYKWIATFRFDQFGYISAMTPVYTMDPPCLFYKPTVDSSPTSYFHRHSEQEITRICDNLRWMRGELKSRYDLDLVFFPIPEKISIHGERVFKGSAYNDFLPRICRGLESRGVPVIDLYHSFSRSTNILYFGSDTHWNERGIELAADVTTAYLKDRGLIAGAEDPAR